MTPDKLCPVVVIAGHRLEQRHERGIQRLGMENAPCLVRAYGGFEQDKRERIEGT